MRDGALWQAQNNLERLIRGDKAAWDAFVKEAAPVIMAGVRRTAQGLSDDTADDLLQDVFLRLCRDRFHLLRTYDPERASLATWLALVARSVTLDSLRKKHIPTQPLEGLSREPPAPRPHRDEPLELPDGLLTPRQTLVLRLLYERDLDVAEAAAVLSVTPQTLRSTRHKALTRLRMHHARRPPETPRGKGPP